MLKRIVSPLIKYDVPIKILYIIWIVNVIESNRITYSNVLSYFKKCFDFFILYTFILVKLAIEINKILKIKSTFKNTI
jgi:hypothetical protein